MSQSKGQSSVAKPPKQPGKDIRSFFGASGSSSSTKPGSHSVKNSGVYSNNEVLEKAVTGKSNVVNIVEDEEDIPQIKPQTTNASKRKAIPISSDEEDMPPSRKKRPTETIDNRKRLSKARTVVLTSSDEDGDVHNTEYQKPKQHTKSVPTRKEPTNHKPKTNSKNLKRKADDDDDDYEEEVEEVASDGATKSKEVKPKKESQPNQNTPKKPNWYALKAAKLAGPSAPGSKTIPDGQANCLAGLSFVFTGELTSLGRDEAVNLAKRFGGRVVGSPSSKTSFVVVGENAGPSKLAAIKKHGLKMINEDEFLNLIATRKGDDIDQKTREKMEKEEEKIRNAAKEMEREERKAEKERKKSLINASSELSRKLPISNSSQLWTSRYAPQQLKDMCGNKTQVEKLRAWLHDWTSSLKSDFKKPGKNGMNIYRAVLITGPPGIGKTTSAHLCARLEGFVPIELNASDARSKKLVENSTNISNTSLDGWMNGKENTNVAGIEITGRTVLIMDEVDGMSAGDRGGVGALNGLIKKTRVPIICIANDRTAPKMKPLQNTTFNLTFRKPEVASIRSRVLSIAFKEKMKIPTNVIDQLIEGTQSDIRQVLNILSTWKLSSDTMTFDEGKNLVRLNEKYTILTPFNVVHKMLGPYLYSPTSRETLGDKMELYFHDHAFVPLFIQENYLKTEPAKLRNFSGPHKQIEQLKLMDKAASSISDGDLVDSLIHGPEQHWSLMPLHSVLSSVRPASFLYGNGGGYGGPNAMTFPQWLGQNSKQNKLTRQLGDVQIRMRLKVSGDKPEIRQHYLPALFPRIVKPLVDVGASAISDIIEYMDEYFLSKEEWDTLVELGLDQNKDEVILKKISPATKTSFTRKYNSSEHPVPFHKAQDFGRVPKKLAGGAAPDLEEAFDLEEDAEEEPEQKEEELEDISKDSLIKTGRKGKGKGAPKGKAGKAKTSNK